MRGRRVGHARCTLRGGGGEGHEARGGGRDGTQRGCRTLKGRSGSPLGRGHLGTDEGHVRTGHGGVRDGTGQEAGRTGHPRRQPQVTSTRGHRPPGELTPDGTGAPQGTARSPAAGAWEARLREEAALALGVEWGRDGALVHPPSQVSPSPCLPPPSPGPWRQLARAAVAAAGPSCTACGAGGARDSLAPALVSSQRHEENPG